MWAKVWEWWSGGPSIYVDPPLPTFAEMQPAVVCRWEAPACVPLTEEQKECPWCYELIKARARRCPHCTGAC